MPETRSASVLRRLRWPGLVLLLLAGAGVAWNAWRIELAIISEPTAAVVRIDGERRGLTPLAASLAPGRHLVELELDGYAPFAETVEVARGGRPALSVALERGTGRLSLLSNPRGAWVELDGARQQGVTPLELEYVTGPVLVRMGLAERHEAEHRVLVLDGRTTEVNLDLARDPHGELRVDVSPRDAEVRLPDLDIVYAPGVRVPVAEHLIEIARAGYETRRIRFRVMPGENRTSVRLVRSTAPLEVRTTPAAEVSVSWRDRDARERSERWTPGLEVPVGDVDVRARALGHRIGFRRVNVGEGGARVSLTLEPIDVAPGSALRDTLASGGEGPRMIVVPAGRFVMGDDDGPPSLQPARTRVLFQPFGLSAYEVSVAEFRRFAAATGAKLDARNDEDAAPVRYVDHDAAVAYADWLTAETGAKYRLPSEGEWEYAARAGTDGDWWFGDDAEALCAHANIADASTKTRFKQWQVAPCDDGHARLAPVGSLAPNPLGLHDMLGNVSEWVRECGMPPYANAEEDGSAVIDGAPCASHGHRGGAWDGDPSVISALRRATSSQPKDDLGIRLLREL
ncbi:MAG: SUMF1/EgtB/PvdO family nonheme iron enzyme [Pseudomonadales bacterium]|jgi:formylglycine-generating enzyme required for sulfatase activity|nr:SUMF1/EgtB/PvdO family nonheme iron enzyme [Pseudomonadales bacterium]